MSEKFSQNRLGILFLFGVLLTSCGGADEPSETCSEGALYCVNGAVHQCASDGTKHFITDCADGLQCMGGVCTGFDLSDEGRVLDEGPPGDSGPAAPSDPGTVPEIMTADTALPPLDESGAVDQGLISDPGTPEDILAPQDQTADAGIPDLSEALDLFNPDSDVSTATPFSFVDYNLLPNLLFQDDIVDIVYVPGEPGTALVLSRHAIARIGPDMNLEVLAEFDDIYLERLGFAPGFGGALIVGRSGTEGRIIRIDPTSGAHAEVAGSPVSGVPFYAQVPDSESGFYVFGRKSGNENLTYVYRLIDGDGPGALEDLQLSKAFVASAGLTDAISAQTPNILFGKPFMVTSHGLNGADSKSFIPSTGNVVENGWSPGFGNAGRGAWKPGGTFGMVAGTSSNKVYVFNGGWEMVTLPTVGNAATPNAVAFSPSGNLAMIVGRAVGSPLQGTAVIYESTGPGLSNGTFSDWSIPGFGSPPYNANSSTHLLSVAFDPSSSCGRGLIGTTVPSNQGFSLLIGFNTAPCL